MRLIVNMGARSYVPQLGRFLQPGGSANAYAYTFGDLVNTFDPSGEYHEAEYYVSREWESKYGEADPLKVVEWGYDYSDLKECFAEEGDCEQAAHDIEEHG